MTLDDKSAPSGREPRISDPLPVRLPEDSGSNSFSDVVDEACKKLKNRQIKYSIQRIQKMEELLCNLEKELDDFLGNKEI